MIKNILIKNSIQQKYINKRLSHKLVKNYKKSFSEIINEINSKKTLSILKKNYKFNFNAKELNRFRKFKKIIIIGMGGSILGLEAINNFLEEKIKKKIYFFDDINDDKILNIKKEINVKKTLFIIISKSGNTIETLSNTLVLNIIKKNAKNIIFISKRKNNSLYAISKKFNLYHIEHKEYISGRDSVLSEVGIVPAFILGLNIQQLRSKTLSFLNGKSQIFLKKSAIKLTNLICSKKISNLVFLNYSPKLNKFLFWCQQLIAESLGKRNTGLMPVVSNVPKDHHSLLQLYLDGPKNKIFYIFSIEEKSKNKIGKIKLYNKDIKILTNKSLSEIKKAQQKALIKSFKKNNIPFREFSIKNKNEQALGELFSYFILETVLIGKLMKINPFDQPAVEEVKIYTRDYLN